MAKFGKGILRQDRSTWGICVGGGHQPIMGLTPKDLSDYCIARLISENLGYGMYSIDQLKEEVAARIAASGWSAPDVTPVQKTDEQVMADMELTWFMKAAGL